MHDQELSDFPNNVTTRPVSSAHMPYQRLETTRFKEEFSFDERRLQFERIREKHPHKIAVIMERAPLRHLRGSAATPPLVRQRKYLFAHGVTIGQFRHMVELQLKEEEEGEEEEEEEDQPRLRLFVRRSLAKLTATMDEVYYDHKDKDGFLYVSYASENVYGWKHWLRRALCPCR